AAGDVHPAGDAHPNALAQSEVTKDPAKCGLLPNPPNKRSSRGRKRYPFRSRMGTRGSAAFSKPSCRRRRWRKNIFSQIGLLLKRWHATRSRREILKTARSNSSSPEPFIMNASFGLQEQLC